MDLLSLSEQEDQFCGANEDKSSFWTQLENNLHPIINVVKQSLFLITLG